MGPRGRPIPPGRRGNPRRSSPNCGRSYWGIKKGFYIGSGGEYPGAQHDDNPLRIYMGTRKRAVSRS